VASGICAGATLPEIKIKKKQMMKKLLTITLTAALLAISGCQKVEPYDDSDLWNEVNKPG
jgi:hypothetical protein